MKIVNKKLIEGGDHCTKTTALAADDRDKKAQKIVTLRKIAE